MSEKKYIVIYHLNTQWSREGHGNRERHVYGPASLEECESHIKEESNCEELDQTVYDVTYYEIKPIKGRYDWESEVF